MMATFSRPPEHLSDVFQYLSPHTHSSEAHPYNSFQSSFFAFHSGSRRGTAEPAVAPADEDNAAAAAECAASEYDTSAASLLSSVRRGVSAEQEAVGDVADGGDEGHEATQQPETASPLSAPAVEATSPPPPVPLSRGIPMSLSPQLTAAKRPHSAGLGDSVGSIELPLEQQPDEEFLTPRARQVVASSSNTGLVGSPTSPLPGSALDRSREGESFTKLGFPISSSSRERVVANGASPGDSVQGSDGAELQGSLRDNHFQHAQQQPQGRGLEARSSWRLRRTAELPPDEHSSSAVLASVGVVVVGSSSRRVSLRRPIFDNDEEL